METQPLFTTASEQAFDEFNYDRTLRELRTFNNGHKEINIVRIPNLFDIGQNTSDYYMTLFQIAVNLEDQVKYENYPPSMVGVSYKFDGELYFELKDISIINNDRVVTYEFVFSAS